MVGRNEDIGLPVNARINAALNTHTGRTFVIYNNRAVAEIDDYHMKISKYESLHTIFPGYDVPPQISPSDISMAIYILSATVNFSNIANLKTLLHRLENLIWKLSISLVPRKEYYNNCTIFCIV